MANVTPGAEANESLERYKTLGAMLGLGDFSIGQLAMLAEVPEATARAVLREESHYVEMSSAGETSEQGHQSVRWRVRRSKRADLRDALRELERQNVGPWLGTRQEDAQALSAGLLVAENVLLRRMPESANAAERRAWMQLARAEIDAAAASWSSEMTESTAAARQRHLLHQRIANLLLELAATELEVGGSKRLTIPAQAHTIVAALLDAAHQLGDERLTDSIAYRLEHSPVASLRLDRGHAELEREPPSAAPRQENPDLRQRQRNRRDILLYPRLISFVSFFSVIHLAVYLVVLPLYLACAVVFIPTTAVVVGAVYTLWMPIAYLVGLWRVLVSRPASYSTPDRLSKKLANTDPAVPQYFYGQALTDVRHAVWLAHESHQRVWKSAVKGAKDRFAVDEHAWATGPLGVGVAIGIAVGTPTGALITAVFALIHLLIVGISIVLVRVTGTMLRGLDSAMLRMKNVRMTCPYCYERVRYPHYACPGMNCAELHREIRPGRYGILRRRCRCGTQMKTLLLFRSSQMAALCPSCGRSLEHRPGEVREIVLPFLGATGSGKSRLLLSMITQLQAWSDQGRFMAEPGDATTAKELEIAKQVLRSGSSTTATPPVLPRAHVIRLKQKGGTRVLHMFDPAGEHLSSAARIQELRYLNVARAFIFVIDPLSVETFWQKLPAAKQAELSSVRSAVSSPELAYDQTLQQIKAMGVRLSKARMAVAFSRADLIGMPSGDVTEWASHELGLGHLIRSTTTEFREARYFCTAAVLDADGRVHKSIAELTHWVLGRTAIDLPRAVS